MRGGERTIGHAGRRSCTLGQINSLREYLAEARPKEALGFLPRRRAGDKLQIAAVANFKGGSAKTTTALYLSQYLALAGFRVLAADGGALHLSLLDRRSTADVGAFGPDVVVLADGLAEMPSVVSCQPSWPFRTGFWPKIAGLSAGSVPNWGQRGQSGPAPRYEK